eukprot:2729541-Pyramimonas_sp.AAC.1
MYGYGGLGGNPFAAQPHYFVDGPQFVGGVVDYSNMGGMPGVPQHFAPMDQSQMQQHMQHQNLNQMQGNGGRGRGR